MAKMDKTKEKEVQKKYIELQLLGNQLKQMQSQIQALDEQSVGLSNLIENLKELKLVKKGTGILVPFSEGIFVKAGLESGDELIVHIGGNVAVKKSIDETIEFIDEKKREIVEQREPILEELQKASIKTQELEESLNALISETEE